MSEDTKAQTKEEWRVHKIERIAEACHNVNKAYCEALGDFSQVEWRLAPAWAKESAKKGVILHLDNAKSTPADSHLSWMQEKITHGWVYGAVKDPNANPPTHPCLVPFEKLPVEQRAKDFIFQAVVKAME